MIIDHKPLMYYLLSLGPAHLYHNKHLMQYLSEAAQKNLWRVCDKVIDKLKVHNININNCINIGTGPGFFEHRMEHRLGIEMPSADLKDTEGYDVIKKQLYVTNYTMDNIWSKDFTIHDCDNVFDNALLMRFVPLNESCDSGNKLYTIVNNIGKYAKNIISIEYGNNFKDQSMEKWLMNYKIDNIENYNMYYINVEKAKKSLRNYITQK